LGSQCSTN